MAQSCKEENACLAPSLRRVRGDATTQVHDCGPPLVFVASEQGHGGVPQSEDGVRMTEIFEPLRLAPYKNEEHKGLGGALGKELNVRELSSTVTSKCFWMLRQRGSQHTCVEDDAAAEHWNELLDTAPSWVSHLGEHCARFTLATFTFSPATSKTCKYVRKCLLSYGASRGSCWFCLCLGGFLGILAPK